MRKQALLVEDDPSIASVITSALHDEGFAVEHTDTAVGRDAALRSARYDVMITDVLLSDADGITSLDSAKSIDPNLPIIIVSAQNTLDTAVRASETEAFEYFPKPFDLDELIHAVVQAANSRETSALPQATEADPMPLVGRSQAMQGVFRLITRVLRNDLSVLILGESGTGKELVAEAIHELGHRKTGPFVAVNTAAIPSELIESELFGHEKGAFTGAVARNIGKFEEASGGTLFLDEIGDMPIDAQTRLLRALQSGRIRRVGGNEEISVNVRVISATNRDLEPLIAAGDFREDLFYRLNVVPIRLPALRERPDDITALSRHFLSEAAADGLPLKELSEDAIARLETLEWRGNVRELRNVIFRLALLSREDLISAGTLDELLQGEALQGERGDGAADISAAMIEWLRMERPEEGAIYKSALAAIEKPLFEEILRQTGGNQVQAASKLGINRNTLRKRLSDLAIDPDAM